MIIYYARAVPQGHIKIGRTRSSDPSLRLRSLEGESSGRLVLELLATEPGGVERERELLARFRPLGLEHNPFPPRYLAAGIADGRIRPPRTREWFRAEEPLLSHIASLAPKGS